MECPKPLNNKWSPADPLEYVETASETGDQDSVTAYLHSTDLSVDEIFRDKVWKGEQLYSFVTFHVGECTKTLFSLLLCPIFSHWKKIFFWLKYFYTNKDLESQDPDTMNSLFISMLQTWSSWPQSVLTFASDPLSNTSIVLLRSPTTTCSWSQTMQLTPSVQRRILIPGPSTTQHQKSFSMTTPVVSQLMRTPLSQWRLWTGPLWPVRDLIPMILL